MSNPLAAPGHNFAEPLHTDTYPAIDSSKANLHGKYVFISGASKGLGRAITLSFAKAGASSIAIGARSDMTSLKKDIHDTAIAAKKSPPRVLVMQLDLRNQPDVDSAAAEVEKTFGRLDIVINNAAVVGSKPVPIADTDPEDWWNTWTVNVRGPYLITRAFLPLLLKGGDKTIVNVSSVGAFLKNPGLSAYQSSKLALLRFTEFTVAEYGEQGLLAYCIHPGNIPGTDIMGPGGIPDALKYLFTETVELGADSIVYLTKERREWLAGRYISCQWDLPQLMAMKDEIVQGDKLKVRMVV